MRQQHTAHQDSRLWLTVLTAMLVLTGVAVSVTQSKTHLGATKNFGRINDNYYRGSQPTGDEYLRLKELGIKTVINLRIDSDPGEPERVLGLGMQYFNIPLQASKAATEEQTSYFLTLVNNPVNWPVYVHCKGGRHRTGALTAVYRISHDKWTADQAWQEMKEYDFNEGLLGGPKAQKRFVYSFYERQMASGASAQK
jgi:tyrosine-protein phosphatase SIW14